MGSGRTDFVHARSPLCTLEAWPILADCASAAHSRTAPAQQLPQAAPRPTPQPAPRGMAAAISAAPPAASTRQKTARPWQAARPRCRHSRCSRSFLVINAQPRTASAPSRRASGSACGSRPSCRCRGACWPALANPSRRMTRDANQPPERSHGSPLATRATAPGAFFAFLA